MTAVIQCEKTGKLGSQDCEVMGFKNTEIKLMNAREISGGGDPLSSWLPACLFDSGRHMIL